MNRPPRGLLPRRIFDSYREEITPLYMEEAIVGRIESISAATRRYREAGMEPPPEWDEERRELMEESNR